MIFIFVSYIIYYLYHPKSIQSVYICLSFLPLSFSISLFFFIFFSVFFSFFLSFSLSLSISFSLSIYLSIYRFLFLSHFLSLFLSLSLSLSITFSVHSKRADEAKEKHRLSAVSKILQKSEELKSNNKKLYSPFQSSTQEILFRTMHVSKSKNQSTHSESKSESKSDFDKRDSERYDCYDVFIYF